MNKPCSSAPTRSPLTARRMKTSSKVQPTQKQRRWMLFSNGCVHGIRHSEFVLLRTRPGRSVVRSSVSVWSVPRISGLLAGAGIALLLLFLLAACQVPRPLRGGEATAAINRPGHTNLVKLTQSDNPREPSRQTVQSEQTTEYMLPPGAPALLTAPV